MEDGLRRYLPPLPGGWRLEDRAPSTGFRGHEGGWTRDEVLALAALAFLFVVTVVWWTAALWPVSSTAPGWLQTARAVCFGAYHDGLPDTGGWILLIGEPIGMTGALLVMWRGPTVSALRRLSRGGPGRMALGAAATVLLLGATAAAWRVAAAEPPLRAAAEGLVSSSARLRGMAPELNLLDQHGERTSLARFSGRPVLVAFTFANCETVCPLMVRDAMAAQAEVGASDLGIVIVTLDPWRDTPARLPHIAERWGLGPDALVVSGDIEAVERTLDAWKVGRSRDARTGDVVHGPTMYVVDGQGRLAYTTAGPSAEIVRLVREVLGR